MSTIETAAHPLRLVAEEDVRRGLRALADCEATIERGLQTFVDVGNALARIRDERLYRDSHATFEEYCRERWDIGRTYAHRTIQAAEVVAMLPFGNTPQTESVARALAPLRDAPGEVADAWTTAVAEHGPTPTAKQVREVVSRDYDFGPAESHGRPVVKVEMRKSSGRQDLLEGAVAEIERTLGIAGKLLGDAEGKIHIALTAGDGWPEMTSAADLQFRIAAVAERLGQLSFVLADLGDPDGRLVPLFHGMHAAGSVGTSDPLV